MKNIIESIKKVTQKFNIYSNYKPYSQYMLFGVLMALIPLLIKMNFIFTSSHIYTLGFVFIYAIAALGLNLLLGYSGLISLGTAGFMGLSSYFAGNLTEELGLPFFLSLVISVVIPSFIGLLVGLVSLRIEGYYLAIATLAVAEIFRRIFERFVDFTGGYEGMKANFPNILNRFQLNKDSTYLLIIIFLVILMILTHNFVKSATGRALLTMRGSESAAQAMGIGILKYRLIAFTIATLYASIAGVLYVHFIEGSYPSNWSLTLSLNILAIIIIGGVRSIGGTVIGAFVVYSLSDLLLKNIPFISDVYGLANVITGVLIIVIILFYPNGLIKIIRDASSLLKKQSIIVGKHMRKIIIKRKAVEKNG